MAIYILAIAAHPGDIELSALLARGRGAGGSTGHRHEGMTGGESE